MNHSQWKIRQTRKLLGEQAEESPAYAEAGHAFALGQAVHDRRTELGLSQSELARRAGMTQPQISNIEGGDNSAFVFTAHNDHQQDEAPPGGRHSAA